MARHTPDTDRGQTVIDYVVGASIFLFVVGGALLFVPTIFEPFSTATTTEAIVADHTASYLTNQLLASDAPATTLDTLCTVAFFSQNASLDDGCGFETTERTRAIVGVDDTTDVSITLQRTRDTASAGVATEEIDGVEYDLHRATDDDQRNTAVASRIVQVNGESHRLRVEVW